MSIGEKIYELRKKKNMSQEDLASVLNVSRQTISKWETGESNPDFDKIVPLCNFFNISTDEFLKGSNPILEEKIERVSKRNRALTYSICIIIMVVMSILCIIFDTIGLNDTYIAVTALSCMGAVAVILVYYYLSKPFEEIPIKKQENNKRKRLIGSIINLSLIIIYLIISFTTYRWDLTWIILLIGLLIKKIIFLCLLLKEEKGE